MSRESRLVVLRNGLQLHTIRKPPRVLRNDLQLHGQDIISLAVSSMMLHRSFICISLSLSLSLSHVKFMNIHKRRYSTVWLIRAGSCDSGLIVDLMNENVVPLLVPLDFFRINCYSLLVTYTACICIWFSSLRLSLCYYGLYCVTIPFYFFPSLLANEMKWNESGFRPPLCTYRLNWARRTSWGWWDDWDDTVLQTQDSKFEPWRSEAEHATSRSRRLPTILTSGDK